jgi:hypothetical protein
VIAASGEEIDMRYTTKGFAINLVGALLGAAALACGGTASFPDTASAPAPNNGSYEDIARGRAACLNAARSYGADVNGYGRESYDGYGRYSFDLTLKNHDGVWPCTYDVREARAEIPSLANAAGGYNGGYSNNGGYGNGGWDRPGGYRAGDLATRAADACVNAARFNKNWDVLDVRAPITDGQDHYRVDMLIRDGNSQKAKTCRYDVRDGSVDL